MLIYLAHGIGSIILFQLRLFGKTHGFTTNVAEANYVVTLCIQRQLAYAMATALDNLAGLGIIYTYLSDALVCFTARINVLRIIACAVAAAIYLPINNISIPELIPIAKGQAFFFSISIGAIC